MSTPVRVAAFVTALIAAFAVAWGAGRVLGPIDTPAPAEHQRMTDRMVDQTGSGTHDD